MMSSFRWLAGILLLQLPMSPFVVAQRRLTQKGKLRIVEMAFFREFDAREAQFGEAFSSQRTHAADLMLPPESPELCQYPDSLRNISKQYVEDYLLKFRGRKPLALLVRRGQCSDDQKARVALEIQRNITSSLRYMVVYNDNYRDPNALFTMKTNASGMAYEELNQMRFMSISNRSGRRTLNVIELKQQSTPGLSSPHLLSNTSENWYFSIEFAILTQPPEPIDGGSNPPGPVNNDRGGGAREAFHWLRFVLFTLLIVSPCVRAGYLWYSGGGRILFRRNSRGRIVGLLYVRPMAYWYASGPDVHREAPMTDTLTEEQVMSLPQVVYDKNKKKQQASPNRSSNNNNNNSNDDGTLAQSIDGSKTSNDDQAVGDENNDHVDDDERVLEEQKILDEEQPPPTTNNEPVVVESKLGAGVPVQCIPVLTNEEDNERTERDELTESDETNNDRPPASSSSSSSQIIDYTSSSMCSICIEDFVQGETILVLPRCQHGFHLECIKPWLTERHGCCPLCKTQVLPSDEEDQDNTTSTNSSSGNNNNDDDDTNNNDVATESEQNSEQDSRSIHQR